MTITPFIEALFNGLSYSSILILTALGLAITFGVMRVINMAHGEMLMLGAYTGYVVTDAQGLPKLVSGLGNLIGLKLHVEHGLAHYVSRCLSSVAGREITIELNLYCTIPVVFITVGLVGYLLERGLIRFLYGRPLDTLLATWGVGLIFQQLARLVFGADLKPLDPPLGLSGKWELEGASFPHFRLFVIGFTCLCLVAIYVWFYRTIFGLKIRAVTQNRPMASALGISTRRVDALTFAFGTGLAGVAGYIVGHMYNVNPNMGADYIVDAFIVVILGGMGHLGGTIAAGLVIGTLNSVVAKLYGNGLVAGIFPPSISEVNLQMAKVSVLLLVIAFIQLRPSGLVATKERIYD